MTPDQFLTDFAEILELPVSDLTMDQALDDLSVWDSINVLSYMMLVDEKLGKQVDPEAVKSSTTVRDLYDLAVG